MVTQPDHDGAARSRRALLLLVLAGGLVLLVPAFLYTIAPEGPLRDGDSVYSTGRHIVYFVRPDRYREAGYTTYCVLEPRDPLLIVRRLPDRPGESAVARFQGVRARLERPFCPPQAEVVVRPHQVTTKVHLWGAVRDAVAGFLAR
jgi:hypothetical protein